MIFERLRAVADSRPTPPDWCYVHNFDDPHRPRALRLPPGAAPDFRRRMADLVAALQVEMARAFGTDEYEARRRDIIQREQRERQAALQDLNRQAQAAGLAIVQTPVGHSVAAVRDGQPLTPDALRRLPESERGAIQHARGVLDDALADTMRALRRRQRQARDQLHDLNVDVARSVVQPLLEDLRDAHRGHEDVTTYLLAVERHATENFEVFGGSEDGGSTPAPAAPVPGRSALALSGQRARHPCPRQRGPAGPRGTSHLSQPLRPDRAAPDHGRGHDGFHHDQARRAPRGERRILGRAGRGRASLRDRLRRAQAGAARSGDPHRDRGGRLGVGGSGASRSRTPSAGRQGGARRRAVGLLPAPRRRSRLRRSVQGPRRVRHRDRAQRRQHEPLCPVHRRPLSRRELAALRPHGRRARGGGGRAPGAGSPPPVNPVRRPQRHHSGSRALGAPGGRRRGQRRARVVVDRRAHPPRQPDRGEDPRPDRRRHRDGGDRRRGGWAGERTVRGEPGRLRLRPGAPDFGARLLRARRRAQHRSRSEGSPDPSTTRAP